MAGCPHNPANTAAVLVHYLTFNDLPALDQYNRPLFAYGRIIHDQCERRAHYDAGRFVTEWGDEGHRKGWCLYKMGCKGPAATFNCPVVQWNDHTSWPIRAGHGCIACASPRFWDHMSPFYDRLPNVPGFGVEVTAGEIGLGTGRRGRGRRHRARPDQDDQARAQTAPPSRRRAEPQEGRTDMARMVVDPVTRIEGHLRIEAQVDGGKISDAWSSGTMFRGIELILQGPRSARSLDLGAAHLRSLHHGARPRQRARGGRRAADRGSGKRPHRAQPHRRLADGAGSRHPLLSSACAGLGGCRLGAEGRSGQDLATRAVHLGLRKIQHHLLQRRAGAREGAWSTAAS